MPGVNTFSGGRAPKTTEFSLISHFLIKLWCLKHVCCQMATIGVKGLRDSLLVQEFRFQRPSSVCQCCLNTVTAKKCPAMFVGGANPG